MFCSAANVWFKHFCKNNQKFQHLWIPSQNRERTNLLRVALSWLTFQSLSVFFMVKFLFFASTLIWWNLVGNRTFGRICGDCFSIQMQMMLCDTRTPFALLLGFHMACNFLLREPTGCSNNMGRRLPCRTQWRPSMKSLLSRGAVPTNASKMCALLTK